MRFFPLILILLVILPMADLALADGAPAAVFVVRHAEKEVGEHVGRNPDLTEAGRERAEALLELVGEAGLDAIYVTQWLRTQETAAPTAEALEIPATIVQTDDGFEATLAKRILHEHGGEVILVVGHSNTNPALLTALGAKKAPAISDDDYDDVYLMVYPESADGEGAQLLRLGYGEPTP